MEMTSFVLDIKVCCTTGRNFPWHPSKIRKLHVMDDINHQTIVIALAEKCREDTIEVLWDRLEMTAQDWEQRYKSQGNEMPYCFALAGPGDTMAANVRLACDLPPAKERSTTVVILDMMDERSFYLAPVSFAHQSASSTLRTI